MSAESPAPREGRPAHPRVALGRSGLAVAPIGTGTWQWADRHTWGGGSGEGGLDTAGAFEAAVAGGVELFDTAEIYGRGGAERTLGAHLARTGARVHVATKYYPFPLRLGPGAVSRAIDGSLKRLGVARIALYQVHFPWSLLSQRRLLGALAAAVRDGRIQAVGVSNYGPRLVRRAHRLLAAHGVPLAAVQVHYSLLHRAPEATGLLELCRELDVAVLAYSPLEQGLLTGRFGYGQVPDDARGRTRAFARSRLALATPLLESLARIGEAHGATPAQVALAWVIDHPGVIALPGARVRAHAESNAAALGWALPPKAREELDAQSRFALAPGPLERRL